MKNKDTLNIKRSRLTAVMTLMLSLLAFYASALGLLDKNIYNDVLLKGTITKFLIYGGLEFDTSMTFISSTLTIVSLMLFIPYMLMLKKEE